MSFHFASVAGVCAALALCGCAREKKGSAQPPAPPNPKAIGREHPGDPECAAPIDLAPPVQVRLGERVATHSGYKLTFQQNDADGELVLGVLGPVHEDSGANLVAIQRYRQFFAEQKADAIVLTGDLGESAEGIARLLRAVAEAKVPVLVVAGHRECRADFTNGFLQAQGQANNLVNMNAVRAVQFPEAALVSLPGLHDPNYLGCATACRYFKETVDEVIRLAREAEGPVVLVSHGPPRGTGAQALDFISDGRNVGDAEINRAIKEADIPFGLFANIEEAGGRASSSPDGAAAVAEGERTKRLYLNPGPADTIGWELNDGTQSFGMAAVFRLREGAASFQLYRGRPLTAAEKAQAQALAPVAPGTENPLGTQAATSRPIQAVPASHPRHAE